MTPTNFISCTACSTGLDPAKQCSSTMCADKFYLRKNSNTCTTCGATPAFPGIPALTRCAECETLGRCTGQCTASTDSLSSKDFRCTCVAGYASSFANGGTCEQCQNGYYDADAGLPVRCQRCPANCAKCTLDAATNQPKCQDCNVGWRHTCSAANGCPSEGKCDQCAPGFLGATCTPMLSFTTITNAELLPSYPTTSINGFATFQYKVTTQAGTDSAGTAVALQPVHVQFLGDELIVSSERVVSGSDTTFTFKIVCNTATNVEASLSGGARQKYCRRPLLVFTVTDSTGFTASSSSKLGPNNILVQSANWGAPTKGHCPPDMTISQTRYLGRPFSVNSVFSPVDPSFTLTTKVAQKSGGTTSTASGKTESFLGATYTSFTPRLAAGENEFTLTATQSDPANKTNECKFKITVQDDFTPELSCWKLPSLPSSPGHPFTEVVLPLPDCNDKGTEPGCDVWKDNAGTAITVTDGKPTSTEKIYIGTQKVKRTGCDLSGKCGECTYDLTVVDLEKPKCGASRDVVVAMPSPTTPLPEYRRHEDCPIATFDIVVSGTDNSAHTATAVGVAPPAPVAALGKGCKCAEGDNTVNGIKCAKQTCTHTFRCTEKDLKTYSETLMSKIVDAAGNESPDCPVKVTFTDQLEGPFIVGEKDGKCETQGATVETDAGKNFFSTKALRIDTLQRDGGVYDFAGGVVTCTSTLPAEVKMKDATEYSLSCVDHRGLKKACTFKLPVVDRELPTFNGDSDQFCGKESTQVYEYDSAEGATVKQPKFDPKDNDAAPTVSYVIDGGASTNALPAKFKAGFHFITATLTDASDNKAYCAWSFQVRAATKAPTLKYDPAKIAKDKVPDHSPTPPPTANPTPASNMVWNVKSCKNRCNDNALTKAVVNVIFECSCQHDVCVPPGSTQAGIPCCADIDTQCKRPANPIKTKCAASNCGGSAGAGDQMCFCDANCASKGDCCQGFDFLGTCCPANAKAPSCKGKCDSTAGQFSCVDRVQSICYCDKSCTTTGDCCSDYKVECAKP